MSTPRAATPASAAAAAAVAAADTGALENLREKIVAVRDKADSLAQTAARCVDTMEHSANPYW